MFSVREKYKIILDAERNFAYTVARSVLDKPKISVWIILIPVLFLFYAHKIQQYKKGIHDFAAGLLKSKTAALNIALQNVAPDPSSEKSSDAYWDTFPADSEKTRLVRAKHKAELEVLIDHYSRLLQSPGSDHESLLRNSYGHGGEYRRFLNRLMRVEEELHQAVLDAYHPTDEAAKIVRRMEAIAEKLRLDQLEAVFG